MLIDALSVLCAQLTRDLLAIAKFLLPTATEMTWLRRLEAATHWHMGKHITKCQWRSCWLMEKTVLCMREGEKTSFWTYAKIKPALSRATDSLPWKIRYVSCHFRRSYLKANKVSKIKGTRKIECAYNFWKCADAVCPKLSKSVHAWRNCGLPKLARLLRHTNRVISLFGLVFRWAKALRLRFTGIKG